MGCKVICHHQPGNTFAPAALVVVAVLVLILLVAAAATGLRILPDAERKRTRRHAPARLALTNHGEPLGRKPTEAIVVPLIYDNGVYLVPVFLGRQRIFVVADTGSSELLVASHDCRECDDEQGLFDKEVSSTYQELSRWASTAHYGTQSDTVIKSAEELSFRSAAYIPPTANGDKTLACGTEFYDMLRRTRDALDQPSELTLVARFPDVRFNLVIERKGDSNYNILGLKGPDACLFLAPAQKVIVVCLDPENGWISFGRPVQFSCVYETPIYFPLVQSPDFFKTKLLAITVEYEDGVRVRVPHVPPEALWDTGSNMLSVPSSTFEALEDLGIGAAASAPNVLLHFQTVGGRGERGTLALHRQLYTWEDGALLIEEDNSHPGVIVLGSLLLQYFVLEICEAEGRIGVAKSKACDDDGCVLRRN